MLQDGLELLVGLLVQEAVDEGFLSEAKFSLTTKKTAHRVQLDCFDIVYVHDDDLCVVFKETVELALVLLPPGLLILFVQFFCFIRHCLDNQKK